MFTPDFLVALSKLFSHVNAKISSCSDKTVCCHFYLPDGTKSTFIVDDNDDSFYLLASHNGKTIFCVYLPYSFSESQILSFIELNRFFLTTKVE